MDESTAATAVPGSVDVEAVLANHVARRGVWVAPVLILFFGVVRGWEGAVASAIGVAVVIGNFLLSGWALSMAARISLAFYQAAALFGFFLRLVLITVSLLVLGSLTDVDRLALGLSVVIAYLVLLSWEAVAVARGKERELDWT